ncbi:MAG: creatininase family protein [Candidatus Bathyarchaeota archaeon]|nr:creatininase family protein [Candidatus Bathyarchaeota archaeon]MDH5687438.1 creatininase family protein [Candidatus Bathyarchaeota archaeon]
MKKKVRYEELLPHEMEEIIKDKPIAYLPFGTLEWHGLHLALGNDAVKAYELCLRVAEKAGGVIVPATYWAIGGMPHPWTTRLDAQLIERLFYAIFEQMAHVGFKVVVAMTGHYGIEQFYTLKKAACEFMHRSNLVVAPMPEYEVALEKGYRGDHAAKWETSILWALRPELVDVSRLSKNLDEPLEGVGGEDPRVYASKELGEEVISHMVDQLSKLALRMLRETSPLDRARYIRALNIQVRVLERIMKSPSENKWAMMRTETYERFVNALWRGDYVDAIKEGEAILSRN